nr:protocadherin beta-9-like isoform X2 [Biomphalaria glabrata]
MSLNGHNYRAPVCVSIAEVSEEVCPNMSPCKCRQLVISILVSILVVITGQQECDVQLPDLIHVKETDPAGKELLTVKASLGTVWTYSLESQQHSALKGYFNFTPSDNKQTFILRLTRPLDLEAIKRSLDPHLSQPTNVIPRSHISANQPMSYTGVTSQPTNQCHTQESHLSQPTNVIHRSHISANLPMSYPGSTSQPTNQCHTQESHLSQPTNVKPRIHISANQPMSYPGVTSQPTNQCHTQESHLSQPTNVIPRSHISANQPMSYPGVTSQPTNQCHTQESHLISWIHFSFDTTSNQCQMFPDTETSFKKVNLDVLLFSLYCRSGKLSSMKYIVPLGVAAVNEFPPTFNTSRISLKVNETTPIGRSLLSLVDWSHDDDVNFSEREIYDFTLSANQSDSRTNALNWIHISNAYDGVLTLKRSLDYESLPENKKYLTTGVTVKDVGGLTGTAIVTLYVLDEDDLPPVFHFPGCMPPCSASYSADVSGNTTGVLTDVAPGPIKATDGDALNYNITYSISQGPENFIEFFRINPTSGEVAILQELEQTGLMVILLLIEAREVSPLKRSSKVTLLVTVRDGLMAHRAGYLLVIVIVIAIILFIAVIALTTGCLVWRMKYKSQVHSVVMQEMSQDSVVIRADPFNGGHLNDHVTAKRDNDLQLDQTEPLKSMEIPTTETNLRGDSIDVNFNQTSDFLPNVEQLETEYAEVDIDNTSQWQRISTHAHHSYDKGHNDLAPPPAQYVDNLGYELPRSSHRPRTNFDPEGRTLARGYTCRPLPVPTDTLDDENPYATVQKMRSFFRSGLDDPEGAIVSKFKSPLVSNSVSIDVFDATRDYQELEVYFGSYTGTSSSGEMDRSVDVQDLSLDPRDNLYWTVVTAQDDDNLPERFPDSYV